MGCVILRGGGYTNVVDVEFMFSTCDAPDEFYFEFDATVCDSGFVCQYARYMSEAKPPNTNSFGQTYMFSNRSSVEIDLVWDQDWIIRLEQLHVVE